MKPIKILLLLLAVFFTSISALAQSPAAPGPHDKEIAAVKAEISSAEELVRAIVNQPVTSYPLNTYALVHVFSPGWFHQDKKKPDYKADVRKTQEFPYDKYNYVTSDVTPGVMFKGQDLEFNSNIKYYYTDLNLPKKRLSDVEMQEVNRFYGIIAADEKKLKALDAPPPGFFDDPVKGLTEFFNSPYGAVFQLIVLSLAGFLIYRKWYK